MATIYILSLKDNKYYVGRTFNPQKRIQEHFDGKGSFWTRLHPPEKICETIQMCTKYDEDKYVIIYMDAYGIDNVRGGSWSNCVLDSVQIEMAVRMLKFNNDKCGFCKGNHFMKDCDKKDQYKMKNIETTCIGCKETFKDQDETLHHKKTCTKFWDIEIIDPDYFEWAQHYSINKQCDIWIINKIHHKWYVYSHRGSEKGVYDDKHQTLDYPKKRAIFVYGDDIVDIYIRSQFQIDIEELKSTLPK